MEQIDRSRSCCFTGHRPSKMGLPEEKLKALLWEAIQSAVAAGYTTFITGMAPGVDIWAAEIVLELKQESPELLLVCALPYPRFTGKEDGKSEWPRRAGKILQQADAVVEVSPRYLHSGVYQLRNIWMVDHASLVIAAFNGEPGGTHNTILYARRKGIEVHYLPME